METDKCGFLYVGRALRSTVSKIGFTTRRDPEAYVIQRFGGLLEVDIIIPVSHARSAEKIVHFALGRYMIESFRSRELFFDSPPEETQATLSWAAQLVDHPEHLRAYIQEHSIRLLLNEETPTAIDNKPRSKRVPSPKERVYLAEFCGVRHVNGDFLDTSGTIPVYATTFLKQVVDEGFTSDRGEMDSPPMAAMARELLQVLGFATPLDHDHVTATLKTLRPALASTAFPGLFEQRKAVSRESVRQR
jgi:hypothetical protein